jgi:hypothetical protein
MAMTTNDEFTRLTEQQRKIAELEKERDEAKQSASDYDKDCIDMRYQRDLADARFSALQSSARQMKEALEPFAKEASFYEPAEQDGKIIDDEHGLWGDTDLTVGDCRRARNAIGGESCENSTNPYLRGKLDGIDYAVEVANSAWGNDDRGSQEYDGGAGSSGYRQACEDIGNRLLDIRREIAASLDAGPDWRKEAEKLAEALKDTLAHLVASTSLLSLGGKKAAPSDKMFDQMLVDYEASIERGRVAFADFNRAKGGGDENA